VGLHDGVSLFMAVVTKGRTLHSVELGRDEWMDVGVKRDILMSRCVKVLRAGIGAQHEAEQTSKAGRVSTLTC